MLDQSESRPNGDENQSGGKLDGNQRIELLANYQFPKGTGIRSQKRRVLPNGETIQNLFFSCSRDKGQEGGIWSGCLRFFRDNSEALALSDYEIAFVVDGNGEFTYLGEGVSSVEYGVEVIRYRHFIPRYDDVETWQVETLVEQTDELFCDTHLALKCVQTFDIPLDHPLRRPIKAAAIRVSPHSGGDFGGARQRLGLG